MQRKIAVAAIGPSALRARPTGTIACVREFCAGFPLAKLCTRPCETFGEQLDAATAELQGQARGLHSDWGGARKALNLFLRDACNNRFLCEAYSLRRLESRLEIPLDGLVARWLLKHDPKLPAWEGIKRLTPAASVAYQASAHRHASRRGVSRVHLDLWVWLEERVR